MLDRFSQLGAQEQRVLVGAALGALAALWLALAWSEPMVLLALPLLALLALVLLRAARRRARRASRDWI